METTASNILHGHRTQMCSQFILNGQRVMWSSYGPPEIITGEVIFPLLRVFLIVRFTGISSKRSQHHYRADLRL